eukprot:2967426-Amphidinium_carterae.3
MERSGLRQHLLLDATGEGRCVDKREGRRKNKESKGKDNKGKGKGAKGDSEGKGNTCCHKCGAQGHIARQCPSRSPLINQYRERTFMCSKSNMSTTQVVKDELAARV